MAGSDADGDELTYALVTQPSNGVASLSGSTVTYTPEADYNGSDSFTFTASDGFASSSAATVSITVTPVNDTPTATAQSVAVPESSTYKITLVGKDLEGDALTYSLSTQPSHGSAFLSGSVVTYEPETYY